MRNRVFLISFLLIFLFGAVLMSAQEREKLNGSSITRILMTAFPDLKAEDIEIKLLKRLASRVKVNLSIQERNAVLYLTWQRSRQGYRWWFEKDEETSLVFLSKTTTSARVRPAWARKAQAGAEVKASEKAQPQEPRIVTIEIKKPETASEPTEITAGVKQDKPAIEKPQVPIAAEKKPVEQEKPVAEVEPKVDTGEAQKEEPEPEVKPVEKIKPEVETEKKPAESEPQRDRDVESELKPEPAATKPEPEPIATEPEETAPVIEPKPVEEEAARKTEPEPIATELEETAPARELKPVVQPATEKPPVEQSAATTEAPVTLTSTAKDFVISFVTVLGKGKEDEYRNFLFRPSEITVAFSEEDFERGVSRWTEQFNNIHSELKTISRIEITRILLQKAQTEDLERKTLESLRNRVKSVNEIYTFTRIEMLLDGKPAQLTIGGLVLTDTGWRIGGRVELIH